MTSEEHEEGGGCKNELAAAPGRDWLGGFDTLLRVAILALGLGGVLVAEPSAAQTCPGTGSCCEANGSPGCDDATCCQQICDLDGFCCFDWDATCANSAQTLCAVCSGASCPGPGDCCVDNGTPSCDDNACCQQVCAQDGSCCSNSWDQNCADLALTLCGGGSCSGATCEGIGDCCSANGSPSCEQESCCAAVCAQDAFCCETVWDSQCAALAESLCAVFCSPPVAIPVLVPLWGHAVLVLMLLATTCLFFWSRRLA